MKGTRPTDTQFRDACKDASGTPHWYASSEISTDPALTFSYGVAAARIRFDNKPGQHGVWWLQAPSKGTEIDIIESYAQAAVQIDAGVHWWDGSRWVSDLTRVRNGSPTTWSSNYHVFSVEWTSGGYIFRVDKQVLHRSKQGLTSAPHYAVLSNWASDWEVKLNNGGTAYTVIDWTRIWQR
jgi:hypothetical protein